MIGTGFAAAFADADAGRLAEAVEGLQAGLAIEPDNLAARTRLGMIQRSLGDLDAALTSFERVYAVAPNVDSVRLNLALSLVEEIGASDSRLSGKRQVVGRRATHCAVDVAFIRVGFWIRCVCGRYKDTNLAEAFRVHVISNPMSTIPNHD